MGGVHVPTVVPLLRLSLLRQLCCRMNVVASQGTDPQGLLIGWQHRHAA
jgi:hypothetical protein